MYRNLKSTGYRGCYGEAERKEPAGTECSGFEKGLPETFRCPGKEEKCSKHKGKCQEREKGAQKMIKVVRTAEDMAKALPGATVYISGPITGVENYRDNFGEAELRFLAAGIIAINPAYMPEGLKYDDYFPTCYAQIAVSSAMCFLPGYSKSTGAAREAKKARNNKKEYWGFSFEQFLFYGDYTEYSNALKMIPETDKKTREQMTEHIKTAKDGIRVSGELLEDWIKEVNPPKTEIEKQNDMVVKVLRSYLFCQEQINAACDEILKLDSRRKRISVLYSEVHGGGGNDYTEAVIDNITELENDIVGRTKQLQSERAKVQIWIDALEDYRERNVLTRCYLNDMKFEDIAKELSYEYGYVRKLHRRGINKLRELFTKEIEEMQKKEQKGTTKCGIV